LAGLTAGATEKRARSAEDPTGSDRHVDAVSGHGHFPRSRQPRYGASKTRLLFCAPAFRIDNDFAILLRERPDVRIWKNVEHRLRWPAKADAFRRHYNGPVDENRMGEHEIDELIIAPFRVSKPKLTVGRALLSQHRARRNAHCRNQLLELLS